jgi:hypothetical protein
MSRRSPRRARPARILPLAVALLPLLVGCAIEEKDDPDADAAAYRDLREVKGSASMFSSPEPSFRRGHIPEGR